MATTTITEIALKNNIPYIYLFRLVKKARIKPVINKKIQINGYLGIPYKKNDLKDVVGLCKNKTFEKKKRGEKQITTINVSESIKKYNQEEICMVLRKDNKHYLWNKIVTEWNFIDWNEFEYLKNK